VGRAGDRIASLRPCRRGELASRVLDLMASHPTSRERSISQAARDAGLSRGSLYNALSGERTAHMDTLLKVTAALALRLHAEAAQG